MKRAEREIIAGRALLRPQDPERRSRARRAPRCWCWRPRWAAETAITDYLKLFDYDVNLRRRPPSRRRGASRWTSRVLRVPGRAVRRQPDHRGDPRLPGRARGRARRHLRRPLARPDRGARLHDRAARCPSLGRTRTAPGCTWCSLAFTFVGAAIFSTIKSRRARIPQEAIIGITYAVASAATILAMSKATSESEHLKDMLVGNILAVSWPEVANTAGLYAAIGVFHYVFRRQFLAISLDHDRAETRRAERALLGLPLLRLVRLRGDALGVDRGRAARVLLPDRALGRGDALRRDRIGPRLAIGWTMGTVVSALGIYLSVKLDLPTGRRDGLHVRPGADPDGRAAAAAETGQRPSAVAAARCRSLEMRGFREQRARERGVGVRRRLELGEA